MENFGSVLAPQGQDLVSAPYTIICKFLEKPGARSENLSYQVSSSYPLSRRTIVLTYACSACEVGACRAHSSHLIKKDSFAQTGDALHSDPQGTHPKPPSDSDTFQVEPVHSEGELQSVEETWGPGHCPGKSASLPISTSES